MGIPAPHAVARSAVDCPRARPQDAVGAGRTSMAMVAGGGSSPLGPVQPQHHSRRPAGMVRRPWKWPGLASTARVGSSVGPSFTWGSPTRPTGPLQWRQPRGPIWPRSSPPAGSRDMAFFEPVRLRALVGPEQRLKVRLPRPEGQKGWGCRRSRTQPAQSHSGPHCGQRLVSNSVAAASASGSSAPRRCGSRRGSRSSRAHARACSAVGYSCPHSTHFIARAHLPDGTCATGRWRAAPTPCAAACCCC